MNPDVVEVRVNAPLSYFVRFADGVCGTVRLAESHPTGVFAALADPAVLQQVQIVDVFVTWPGEIDLAPDAMDAAIRARGEWRLVTRTEKWSQEINLWQAEFAQIDASKLSRDQVERVKAAVARVRDQLAAVEASLGN